MRSRQPVGSLLARLRSDPGRPRITWYSEDERVELSGHVLDNWVSKTTNLLAEELDVGPGSTVLVDLPGHWRALVWWLAVLRSGACLVTTGEPDVLPDVVVTTDPEGWPTAPELVLVTLPALARRAAVPLPAGAIDAAAAVMTYADVLGPVADPAPTDVVLRTGAADGSTTVAADDLLKWAQRTADVHGLRVVAPLDAADGPGTPDAADEAHEAAAPRGPAGAPGRTDARRVLLAADGAPVPLLAACLAVLAADGSVVLCSAGMADALRADPGRLERLRAAERVTD